LSPLHAIVIYSFVAITKSDPKWALSKSFIGHSVIAIKSDAVTKEMKKYNLYDAWVKEAKYTIKQEWEGAIRAYTQDTQQAKNRHGGGARPSNQASKYAVATFKVMYHILLHLTSFKIICIHIEIKA